MHERGALVVDAAAELRERVDDALDALLVARDRRCRDDDGIALVDRERLVLAVCHPRECRERLALGACAHDDDFVVRDVLDVVGIDDVLVCDPEVAKLACDGRVCHHGPAGHDDLAADSRRSVADLLETVDVARERGDKDAARRILDDMAKSGADGCLRRREAGLCRIRRIGEQEVYAHGGEAVDGGVVGTHAVDRRLVELEVARVHDRAGRRLDVDAERCRNRVRHREEAHREGAELDLRAIGDLAEVRVLEPVLLELALDELQGELAREDGHAVREVYQKIRKGSGMVLMAVGYDDATELVLVLEDIGIVGKYEVHARHIVVREHDAGIDEDHIVAVFECRHVLSDAIEASERNDFQRYGFGSCHMSACSFHVAM